MATYANATDRERETQQEFFDSFPREVTGYTVSCGIITDERIERLWMAVRAIEQIGPAAELTLWLHPNARIAYGEGVPLLVNGLGLRVRTTGNLLEDTILLTKGE